MPSQITVVDLQDDANIKYEDVVQKIDDTQTKPNEIIEPVDPVVMKKPKMRARNPKKKKDEMPEITLDAIQEEVKPVVVQEEVKPVVVQEEVKPVVAQEEEKIEVVQDVIPILEDAESEEKLKTKKKGCYKTVELVQCPKCGKNLTQRTLKYSHANKCPKNDNPKPEIDIVKPQKEIIEVSKDIEPAVSAYAQRLKKIKEKQQTFKDLATLAF